MFGKSPNRSSSADNLNAPKSSPRRVGRVHALPISGMPSSYVRRQQRKKELRDHPPTEDHRPFTLPPTPITEMIPEMWPITDPQFRSAQSENNLRDTTPLLRTSRSHTTPHSPNRKAKGTSIQSLPPWQLAQLQQQLPTQMRRVQSAQLASQMKSYGSVDFQSIRTSTRRILNRFDVFHVLEEKDQSSEPKVQVYVPIKPRIKSPKKKKKKKKVNSSDGNGGYELTYPVAIVFLITLTLNEMIFRSLTAFSFYFARDFNIPLTTFSFVVIMNFPGNMLSLLSVPYYSKLSIDWVLVGFECLFVTANMTTVVFHNFAGLVMIRLCMGMSQSAVQTEINGIIGAFSDGERTTRFISVTAMAYGLSTFCFIGVGSALEYLGLVHYLYIGSAVVFINACLLYRFIPHIKLTDSKTPSAEGTDLKEDSSSAETDSAEDDNDETEEAKQASDNTQKFALSTNLLGEEGSLVMADDHEAGDTDGIMLQPIDIPTDIHRTPPPIRFRDDNSTQSSISGEFPTIQKEGLTPAEVSILKHHDPLHRDGYMVQHSVFTPLPRDTSTRTTGGTISTVSEAPKSSPRKKIKVKPIRPKYRAYIWDALNIKTLRFAFLSMISYKIALNAYNFSFSKWMYLSYNLGPSQVGMVQIVLCCGNLSGAGIIVLLTPIVGIYGSCCIGAVIIVCAMSVLPFCEYVLGLTVPLYLACIISFTYMFGCQIYYNTITRIAMSTTPVKSLHTSVQSILLTCSSLGGLCGTMGSNMLFNWHGKPAIDVTGLCCGICMLICVLSLWSHEISLSKRMEAGLIDDTRKKRFGKFYRDAFRPDIQRHRHYRTQKSTLPRSRSAINHHPTSFPHLEGPN